MMQTYVLLFCKAFKTEIFTDVDDDDDDDLLLFVLRWQNRCCQIQYFDDTSGSK